MSWCPSRHTIINHRCDAEDGNAKELIEHSGGYTRRSMEGGENKTNPTPPPHDIILRLVVGPSIY